ncbi:MAG TPA: SDR family oxidoreductase [Methylomusa anaerophila]|uniref:Putative ketoacyl reductase n=1 Tax=Methylomusa anaerophila TaxID=1930071 RepID=A0A348AIQ2_9FIRM|nr:SDR family NAD(P)-dependent oxidoreductase [Methylomusa anaerophila]BBB90950.1 putative ketoacyl reductase [Methylomusa anaerophila]HML90423.1 SDR family oxidoreductase [Methylomusa anaerophila]
MERTALVTGAGKGIGKSIALRLAADGFHVILVSRTKERLEEVAGEISGGNGKSAYFTCDVSKQENVEEMISALMQTVAKIDVLVNCAGRSGGGKTAAMDDGLWHDIINTNLNSVYYVTKAVLKKGNMDSGSAIINIASTGGKQGVAFGAAYSASKAGVIAFSKALGKELAKTGITVNAVCPGFVESEMAQKVREANSKLLNIPVEDVKKKFENLIPIGRYIEPDEVAGMVSYLASDKARGITIQALNVCGGLGNY